MVLSPKQLLSYQQANRRYNIWVGAVSSGKTYSSILSLIDKIKTGPAGDLMILGVNRETIQRNVLGSLYQFLGFPEPASKATEDKIYGRRIYFVGAPDESSVKRIQGATLALAYVDEAANIPYTLWKMLQSRLRVPGAQLLATCNPEGPAHWLKKEFLDRSHELDLIYWNFLLDDNPFLTEKYKNDLKIEYTGMWYKRYILGEWAVAHGLIYDGYDHYNVFEEFKNNPNYYIVGIDYGTTNATAAVLCAVTPKQWPQISVVDEYYYDSAVKGRSKGDDELADDIKDFIGHRPITAVYVDPAAASFKIELRKKDLPVLDAKHDVIPGIKVTSKFVSNKNLVIHKNCKTLIEHIQSYEWDIKAAERGEDKPKKVNDHICVTRDTIVQTHLGKIPIVEVKSIFKNILSYSKNEFIFHRSSPTKLTGRNKKILKLTLENGKILRATPDHKVCTKRGYIEIQNLLIDDEILCYNG